VRPIWHYDEKRVKAHFFICMLSYYVIWHIKEAWRLLTFSDEETDSKQENDPIAAAKVSDNAKKKLRSKKTSYDFDIMSFRSLFRKFNSINKGIIDFKLSNDESDSLKLQSKMDSHLTKAFSFLESIHD
jgi:hypothetical protein